MKYLYTTLAAFMLFQGTALAQTTQKAFYIGHSLSDQIAEMLLSMTEDDATISFDAVYQTIPGSPLRWNWESGTNYTPNPPFYYGYNHPTGGLPNGTFTTLVLTEAVARYPAIIDETYEYSELFYEYAMNYNPDTRVFIYEVWHCINSGTPTGCEDDVDANPWRQRLTDDLPMWEGVVDNLNNKYNPAVPVCLIPGGQGMARLYDEIELGTVPGIDTITDIFTDDHHISDIGKYFIACIHFATLFEQSPVGLPHELENVWGVPFEAPGAALALRLQEIALQTVTQYPNNCNSMPGSIAAPEKLNVSFYPNPVKDVLNIISAKPIDRIEIYDASGSMIDAWQFNSNEVQLNTAPFGSGFYLLKVYSKGNVAIEKFLKHPL